jgi:hypothetical protein
MTESFKELDTVVLVRDIPSSGLRAGDLGAVVFVHNATAFVVEFVTASGMTQAILTLTTEELRAVRDDDVLSVRKAAPIPGAA